MILIISAIVVLGFVHFIVKVSNKYFPEGFVFTLLGAYMALVFGLISAIGFIILPLLAWIAAIIMMAYWNFIIGKKLYKEYQDNRCKESL